MSYNGSGTFVVNSAGQPVVTGTVISSTAFNALTADLATGLSTAITKDGQTTTTVRVPFAAGISSTLVTDATSTVTGSITSAGGISCQKNLWVGTGAYIPNLGGANKIINGDMRIDQRNAGASVVPASSAFTVDRWYFQFTQASKVTIGQNYGGVTPPAGFSKYLGAKITTAYAFAASDYTVINQPIEGYNFADLNWGTANAKAATLSFWVYSSVTGTFGGSVQAAAGARSYPFSYTISVASTWELKSVTIAGDTSGSYNTTTGVGLYVTLSLGAGSTFMGTAGSWSGSNYLSATGANNITNTLNATFYVTGVKLEVGSIATPFVPDDYAVSLDKCKRYFQKVGQQTNNQFIVPSGFVSSTTRAFFNVQHGPVFRATPTFAYVGTVGNMQEGNAGVALTALTGNVLAADFSNIYGDVASGLIAKNAAALQVVGAGNYLTFDAEL